MSAAGLSAAELGRPQQAGHGPEQPQTEAVKHMGRTAQHNAAGDPQAAAPWKQSYSLFPSLMEASSTAPSG